MPSPRELEQILVKYRDENPGKIKEALEKAEAQKHSSYANFVDYDLTSHSDEAFVSKLQDYISKKTAEYEYDDLKMQQCKAAIVINGGFALDGVTYSLPTDVIKPVLDGTNAEIITDPNQDFSILVHNGNAYLYAVDRLGKGFNGSVMLGMNLKSEAVDLKVLKFQFGFLDVKEYKPNGDTFEGKPVLVSNGLYYIEGARTYNEEEEIHNIQLQRINKTGNAYEINIDSKLGMEAIERDGKILEINFISVDSAEAAREAKHSAEHKLSDGRALGVGMVEIDVDERIIKQIIPENLKREAVISELTQLGHGRLLSKQCIILVQEFVPGESIGKNQDADKQPEGKVSREQVNSLISRAAIISKAVGELKGIFHRDLTPENIKIGDVAGDVIDFGASDYIVNGAASYLLGFTPKFSHPDLVKANIANGGAVSFEYTSLHEAYSLRRVLQHMGLDAFVKQYLQQDPSAAVLKDITEMFAEAKREQIYDPVENTSHELIYYKNDMTVEQVMAVLKHALSAPKIPIQDRPKLGHKHVSAKLAGVLDKLNNAYSASTTPPSKPAVKFAADESVASLRKKFTKPNDRPISPELSKGRGKKDNSRDMD